MPAYHFSPLAIPSAITALAVVICAVAIVLARFSRTSIALLGIAIAGAAWQLASIFMYLATDARSAVMWARIAAASLPFLAPGVYQFIGSVLPTTNYRRIVSVAGWLVAAQFAILTFTTDYLVRGVVRHPWGFYPAYSGAARVFYPLLFAVLIAIAIVDAVRESGKVNDAERDRIRLFTIAAAIASLTLVHLLPAFGLAIIPVGWVPLLASIVVAAYAIRKHGAVPITPSLPATEIISTMRDLLLVTDRKGKIRFANNAACAFLGYSRDDIVGQQLEHFLAPTDDTQPTLQGRWMRDREYVLRTKMGQPIELTLSNSPVMQDGELTGAVIIGRDLRERKRYEWEAKRAVTLLQSTLDSTADGILVIGQDGRILTANQRFADIWNIPQESMERDEDHNLIGQLIDRIVDPATFLERLAALHEHPDIESVNILELKDGRRIEHYSIGRYLDHEPLRVWSFRDVTARLAAEQAVRESETRYRLLFEQNAAGVCLATIGGRIINCNATFADMVGYEVDEMSNRELRDIFARSAAMDEIRKRLDKAPTVRGIEIEMRRRGGDRVSTLANVSLLGNGENALVHMTAVDISDRKRAEEQIEFQAYHDALTQLPNRRMFVERLELSLLAAKRTRGNVAVLFIDLDRFKTINDTLGHTVADALLVEIANRLRSCVRQTDTVARYGGDEFTIILPDLHEADDAAQVAEKILERVSEPIIAGDTTIEASVSIGIAVYPHDGAEIDTLLRNADDAMYRAKQAGRNQYQLCTEQMKTRAMERVSMQSRLRKAMSDNELLLAYQPQVSLATGAVVGAEAIVRWNDPERGLTEQDDFIPLAEETRLIVPLGEWALFTACQQLRKWNGAGLRMRMAVNISSRLFQQRDLATIVQRAIDEHRIDASQLELEIRETTAMRDVSLTIDVLNQLRDTGVSIAIDDFGSAYSSLGSLRVLPINAVKMDRSLLDTTVEGDIALVNAIIGVSHRLGLRVTADGVETAAEADFLKAVACDEAQGPHFAAAVDPDTFSSKLNCLPVPNSSAVL